MELDMISKKLVKTIKESIDVLLFGTDSKTVLEAVQKLDNPEDRDWVNKLFNCDLDIIKSLVEDGKVPNQLTI